MGVREDVGWVKHDPTGVALLVFSLFVALILQNTNLQEALAYLITTIVYVSLGLYFLSQSSTTISLKPTYAVLFLAFGVIVLLRTTVDPSLSNTVRLAVLLTFTTANFFVLPHLIPFQQFCNIGSRVSALVVLLGFLPYLGFEVAIGPMDLSLWQSGLYWMPEVQPMMSVFVNPNHLGGITLFATIASFREWKAKGTPFAVLLIMLNCIGLLFSNYRAGWIALAAAVALFMVYSLWGQKALIVSTIGGLAALGVTLLMMFAVIPGPEFLTEVSLNGRRALWTDSIAALEEQLLLGHNFAGVIELVGNPHNSYLRMFAAFGIVGGAIYSYLVIGTTVGSARRTDTYSGLILTMLLVAFAIVQVFNQLSFVGISMRSTIIAIIMGYFITNSFRTTSPT